MRRGYTLIEMMAVTVILSLVAATIIPNLGSFKDGQIRRSFFTNLPRLADQARNTAVRTGEPVEVRFNGNSLILQARPVLETDEQAAIFEQESLPRGVGITRLLKNGEESSEEEWAITYYPDGTSEAGGLEFSEGGRPISMQFRPKAGSVVMQNGNLAEMPLEKWQAGELAQTP